MTETRINQKLMKKEFHYRVHWKSQSYKTFMNDYIPSTYTEDLLYILYYIICCIIYVVFLQYLNVKSAYKRGCNVIPPFIRGSSGIFCFILQYLRANCTFVVII